MGVGGEKRGGRRGAGGAVLDSCADECVCVCVCVCVWLWGG